MKYPEFVKKYRPKGTVVKKINGTFYAYYATSKRVPGKSYPVQVVKGIAGTIDACGFHPVSSIRVEKEDVIIRECGFTSYMLMFEDLYIAHCYTRKKKDSSLIFRSLIVYLSNNSYLCDEEPEILTPPELAEKYEISVPMQLKVITKLIEGNIERLEPLKYICQAVMGGKTFESRLTEAQKRILAELEVEENDIRRH